jgi:hypothetical protein
MPKLLQKYFHHLHVLSSCKACERKLLIGNLPTDLVRCICEVCDNLLQGNIPISQTDKKKLVRHKKIIRYLASKKPKSISLKRRQILQQGGAFLPILLPSLLTIAAELLPNLLKK